MPARYEDRILRVLSYIGENLDGDLSLDTLADVAAMSRFHWHRVFAAVHGETCASTIRRIRLARAATELVQSDKPVADICRLCGYPNQRSFARTFKDAYGCSPEVFRKNGELLSLHLQKCKGESKMFPIEIREEPTRKVWALQHKGAYLKIDQTFEKAAAISASRDFWQQVVHMVGIFYHDPEATPEDDLCAHAGFIMQDGAVDVPAGFDVIELPAGQTGVMQYKGPYSGLSQAYKHIYGSWLPESGRDLRDAPPYEVYLNTPRDVAQDALRTDICLPLV